MLLVWASSLVTIPRLTKLCSAMSIVCMPSFWLTCIVPGVGHSSGSRSRILSAFYSKTLKFRAKSMTHREPTRYNANVIGKVLWLSIRRTKESLISLTIRRFSSAESTKVAGELNTQTNFSFDIKMLKPESKQWKIIVNCVEIVSFSVGHAQYTDSSNDVRSARKQQQAEGNLSGKEKG